MPEQIPEVPTVEPGVNPEIPEIPETPEVPIVEKTEFDMKAEIAKAVADLEEKHKNELAGVNRKNSEYEKALKAKELEGKSEAEKTELLLEEKEAILKDIADLNRGRIVDRLLNDSELPLDFAKRIIGDDEEEIMADVKVLKDFITAEILKGTESGVNERLGGKIPEGAGGEIPVTRFGATVADTLKIATQKAKI